MRLCRFDCKITITQYGTQCDPYPHAHDLTRHAAAEADEWGGAGENVEKRQRRTIFVET